MTSLEGFQRRHKSSRSTRSRPGTLDRAPAARSRNGFERTAASPDITPAFHARSSSAPCVVHSPTATHPSPTPTMAGLGDMAGLGASLPDREGGGKKKEGDSDDKDPDVRPREPARLCLMPNPETARRFRVCVVRVLLPLSLSKRPPPRHRRDPRSGRPFLAADAPVQTSPRRATFADLTDPHLSHTRSSLRA